MSNDTITLDPLDQSVLNVLNWRPVPGASALDTLALIAMTADEPSLLGARAITLPDSRTQVLYYAQVRTPNRASGESVVAPYLMLVHREEDSKQVWFERQDVELALG